MWTPPNYLEGPNPFKLGGPPAHWLRSLWAFDDSLVVVPSQQGFYYRLSQRRRPNLPTHIVNDVLFKDSDTRMLAQHNLVPVTTILATANWSNPFLFEELRRRAPWRLGGAERVAADLEAREAQETIDKKVQTDEHLTSLGKDAWGLYNKKIGVRSHMYIPRTESSKKPISPAPSFRIK
jgi:hypothetical protein